VVLIGKFDLRARQLWQERDALVLQSAQFFLE